MGLCRKILDQMRFSCVSDKYLQFYHTIQLILDVSLTVVCVLVCFWVIPQNGARGKLNLCRSSKVARAVKEQNGLYCWNQRRSQKNTQSWLCVFVCVRTCVCVCWSRCCFWRVRCVSCFSQNDEVLIDTSSNREDLKMCVFKTSGFIYLSSLGVCHKSTTFVVLSSALS